MFARSLVPLSSLGLLALTAGAQTLSQSELTPDPYFNGEFGASVAIDGSRAVVGAPGEGKLVQGFNPTGGAYVYERVGAAWVESARIASSGQTLELGRAVDISGDWMAISAPGITGLPQVKMFEFQSGTWIEDVALSTGAAGSTFGGELALEGDTLVVSDRGASLPVFGTGGVYVYERTGGAWVQTAALVGSSVQPSDYFGHALALDGDTLAVSTRNSYEVYIFERTGGAWVEVQLLTESSIPASITQGSSTGSFGSALALDGNTLLVGTPSGSEGGKAYTFEQSGGVWTATDRLDCPFTLTSFANAECSGFGAEVGLFGDVGLVGTSTGILSGAVIAYDRDPVAQTWSERSIVSAPTGLESGFSSAIAWDGSELLVGSPRAGLGDVEALGGLAADPATGILFATNGRDLFDLRGKFDLALIGSTGRTGVESLAFDPGAGTLYGIDTATNELLTLDTSTGAATSLGLIPYGQGLRGLAFDTSTGTLYSTDSILDELVIVDPATLQVTIVGATGFPRLRSLAYDPLQDVLAGVDAKSDSLVHLDRATGAGTAVGNTYTNKLQGLAWDSAAGAFTGTNDSQIFDLDPAVGTQLSEDWLFGPVGGFSIGALDLTESYCTAGTSAAGCTAQLSASGVPSASDSAGFVLDATGAPGNTQGLFFFGTGGSQANAWGNSSSFQCVVPPVRRAGLMLSSGTNGACDGVFTQDLNALWCPTCPKPGVNPGFGVFVQAQLWYRDPLSTSNQTTTLSDAIEVFVGL